MAFENRWSLRITLRKEVEHCSSCNKQWAKFGDLLAKTGEDARGEEDTPNSDDDANPDAPVAPSNVSGASGHMFGQTHALPSSFDSCRSGFLPCGLPCFPPSFFPSTNRRVL